MRNLKLTIQYDGTSYVGWQRQQTGTSIQGLLEDALAPIAGERVTVHGAGRTDAGVHALAQVATVTLDTALTVPRLTRALNAVLPLDVRVLAVEDARPEFHARFSAVGKVYEYRILNAPIASAFMFRYAWHLPQPLDLDAMRTSSLCLVGAHDFAAFQGAGSFVHSTTRTVHAIHWEDGGGYDLPLVMRIEGDGFLRHMVRNIVGTLTEVGVGRWNSSQVEETLRSLDRSRAGPTAPPHGLFLVRVDY
jgi:tRNA pseudouridine38-40 synthase